MPKLDLTRAIRIKGAGGEIAALKTPGFEWVRPVSDPILAYFQSTGAYGLYYTPWDKGALYQDAAGTIPVVNSLDPAALMLDISGNANHASTDVSTRRPQWIDNHLKFDGTDDLLEVPLNLSHTNTITVISLWRRSTRTDLRHLLEFTENSFSTNGAFLIRSSVSGSNTAGSRMRRSSAITHDFSVMNNTIAAVTLYNKSPTNMTSRVDGAEVQESTIPDMVFANDVLYIGGRGNTQYSFAGELYALAIIDHTLPHNLLVEFEQHFGGLAV